MTDATYKGECRLKRWSHGPHGMTVTVDLDDGPDGCKVNPFKDHSLGCRFAVMFVPINDDETLRESEVMPNSGSAEQRRRPPAEHNTDRAQAGTAIVLPATAIGPEKPGISGSLEPIADSESAGMHAVAFTKGYTDIAPASKPKRRWADLLPSQQAAIACANRGFQEWCRPVTGAPSEAAAASYVRFCCGIGSRSELNHDERACAAWNDLWSAYEADTGRRAEER